MLGCWQEARRADKVADHLLRIRSEVDLEYYDNITAVLRNVESASRLLRDLYDLFPIYKPRVPIIVYYLNVCLPSLCQTMREMMLFLDNQSLPPNRQWILMYERLTDQGAMGLPTRFIMFVDLLVQLVRLLSKCG